MRKRNRNIIVFFILVCVSVSCQDIFVTDISNKVIQLSGPSDSLQTYQSTITFWWDELPECDFYQLQIIRLDFSNSFSLVLDTSLRVTQYTVNLVPGSYEWRVRAVNSEYCTKYTSRNISIDSSLNLTLEKIILLSPQHNDTISANVINFSWHYLYNADSYRFFLEDDAVSIIDTLVSDTHFKMKLNDEGAYKWRVSGVNSISQTPVSERLIFIDTTPPMPRTLDQPVNNSIIIDSAVYYKWSYIRGSSSEFDSLYIYRDTSSLVLSAKYKVSSGDFQINMPGGIYYWRVKGFDKAGNIGSYSSLWTFEVVQK